MADHKRIPSFTDDDELTTADYLGQFDIRVQQATKLIPPPEIKDENLKWVQTPAPNAIVWTVGKPYLNNGTTFKYWRQYQVIRDFFELRCPFCNSQDPAAIDCWGKSQMYLEDEILFEWNKAANDDVCPKCKSKRTDLISEGHFKGYNQLHGVVGMRGGKTATASIIATYFEHRLYNLHYTSENGIAGALQQLPNQPFECTFIASSDVQSADTIWAHYLARRKQSPWIQRYIGWIKEIEKKTPVLPGVKPTAYRELEKEILNDHLNVAFNSLNSNSAGMAGRTRLFAYVDELARFQDSESRLSADEAYRVLENSLATVRTMGRRCGLPAWMGSMTSISSPISADDKAMRLIRQAPSIKRMYAFKYPTWEFNPFVTREDLDDSFNKDPMGARRDFGADPPAAAAPLVEDPERFRRAVIDADLKPSCDISYYIKEDATGVKYRAARMDDARFLRAPERYICFPPDTSIIVDNRRKKISDVIVGDEVITHAGRRRKVYDILVNNFDGDLIKISTEKINGYNIKCTPNHPIQILNDNGISWKPAYKIDKTRDYIGLAVDHTTSIKDLDLTHYLPNIKDLRRLVHNNGATRIDTIPNKIPLDADLMRLFGYYLSEGSITDNSQYIKFTFHKKETQYINDVRNIIKSRFNFDVSLINSRNTTIVSVNSIILANLFVAILGRRSNTKFIPQWIMTLPKDLQLQLILGIYRGDGTLLRRKNNRMMVTLGLVNEQVINSVWQILLRLGIPASISKTKVPKLGRYNVWLCRYYHDNVGLTEQIWPERAAGINFAIYKGSDNTYKFIHGQPFFKVKSITTEKYAGKVYNLEVEDDHSYAVETNFACHNCFDAGLTFDTFGGAAAHGEWMDGPEGQIFVTVYDWIMKIIPSKYPVTMDVWFDSTIDIITRMKDRQKIGRIEFDRWNSAFLIQKIRDMGVGADMKGTIVTDFVKFVADANLGRVKMLPPAPDDTKVDPPDMSPAGTAFYELEHLERSPDLKKIFNPRKGERIGFNSDDVAQCVVHVHRMVQETVAIDQTGFQHSPEKRLHSEQIGAARWGMNHGGRLFMPKGRIGGRGW